MSQAKLGEVPGVSAAEAAALKRANERIDLFVGGPMQVFPVERAFATTSITLSIVSALIGIIAALFVDHTGDPGSRWARISIPIVLAASTGVGMLCAKLGRFRLGVLIYVWAVAIAIFVYVFISGQGVYGIALAFLAPLVLACTYLVSIRAGVLCALTFSFGVFVLYLDDVYEILPSDHSALTPEINAMVGWLVLYALCIVTSIFYRRTFDRLLNIARQNEQRFRELFRLIPEPCYLSRDLVVLAANEACSRFALNGRTTIVGQHLLEVFPTDPDGDFEGRLKRAREMKVGEALPPVEFTVRTNDTRRGTFLAVTRKIGLDDGEALLTLLVDITHVKQMREMLIAAQERAQAASVAKSKFLADMSHEIRTPLNAIIGLTELARGEHVAQETRMRYLGLVANAGESLLALLSRVLDLAKIESGQMHLDTRDFDLRSMLQNVAAQYRSIARNKNLTFAFNFDKELPARISGDPDRLRQVLNNLLDNAIKFTKVGGVSLEAERSDTDLLHIRVSDSGIGLSEGELAQLFKPFAQANEGTHARYGGTGLGLALCKELTTLMGGNIRASSREGIGSVFVVELPILASPQEEADTPQATGAESGATQSVVHHFAGRALVVEDHQINQLVIGEMLRELGVTFDIASTAADASRLASARSYAVVLMDIRLPDKDGYAASVELRTIPGYEETPIIAFTASAFKDDVDRATQAGMNDMMFKPVTRSELLAKLTRWWPATLSRPTDG